MTLDECGALSDQLYRSIAECIKEIEHDGSARSQLALVTSTIAIEHGISPHLAQGC
jgi:hypothetical protein